MLLCECVASEHIGKIDASADPLFSWSLQSVMLFPTDYLLETAGQIAQRKRIAYFVRYPEIVSITLGHQGHCFGSQLRTPFYI